MNHHSHPNHRRGSGNRSGRVPQGTIHPGEVIFRMLCHVNTAGGVIGNSGTIIKQLEKDTGSRIRFEDNPPNCHERVVNVIGEAAVDRRLTVKGGSIFGKEGEVAEVEVVEVSRAQEALIRVFERVLEVEGNGNGAIGCRLLSGSGQIGAVLGKGGKIVDAIRKNSGAKIKVLKKEQLPACATPDEELIQIMGGVLAVKKALLFVSSRLQDRTPMERAPPHLVSYGGSNEQHADVQCAFSSLSAPSSGNGNDHTSASHSLSADIGRGLNLDEESNRQKVVFRLLCSTASAGGVIGKGANIVKALEKETGASIKFASPVPGSKERVATIYCFESPDPLYSPAQVATIRVFARSIEVSIDHGLVSGKGNGKNVTARMLVSSNQIGQLIDGGKVAIDISAASGVEIKLLEVDVVPQFAAQDDKVVQIVGEYENVKSALFQVTGKLRDKFFSKKVSQGAGRSHFSPILDTTQNEIGISNSQSEQFPGLSSLDKMDHLGFVQKVDGSHPLRLPHEMSKGRWNADTFGDKREQGSVEADTAISRTVEIVVPEEAFGSVYGENGSNLARLKEISGARVILQDPRPGCNGKVIISGTPDRIQVAQSLLHAFILI